MQNTMLSVPFIYRKCPEKQVYRDRRQVRGGLERDPDWGVAADEHEGISVVKENGLELGCGDGCRTL